jgi:PAS domain S-box-containing protein
MTYWRQQLQSTPTALPIAVFIMGLVLSGLSALSMQRAVHESALGEFQRLSARTVSEINMRFSLTVAGLSGTRALFPASQSVERGEFRAYVASRNLAQELPGVRGLGYIAHVQRADVDAFVAKEQKDEAPQFAIRQLTDQSHDDLYVIKFIEPAANNAGAMGLDVGSEPVRRAGAQAAADTGMPTITGAITLVQDSKKTPGVLMFLPYYGKATYPTNVTERRAALTGLLYAPIVLSELLSGMPEVETGLVDFEIFDSPLNAAHGALMFDADNHIASHLAVGKSPDAGRLFSSRLKLSLPGRELTLSMNSTPRFDASIDRKAPWLVLLGGGFISALLALVLRQLAGARANAEALARSMTADLNRLAEVVKHTSNAVIITNLQRKITWVNEGFERITGYSAQEALGRSPGELLQGENTDKATMATMREVLDNGKPFKGTVLNYAKDGRAYWIEIEIQPLSNTDGTLEGFMAIESDISIQRNAQDRLEAALRDSDALLDTMNLHAIISTADRTGTITDVNDAFCTISGYTREELVGQKHSIVNSGTQTDAYWKNMWETISSGMPWRGELCNRAKDGHHYWVDTFIAPFIGDDGQIAKYISIRTDITASKHALNELRISEERIAFAMEGSGDGVWDWDLKNNTVQLSRRWKEMLGYQDHEIGTDLAELSSRIHPDDKAQVKADVKANLDGKTRSFAHEHRVQCKDGHYMWILNRGMVVERNSHGTALRMVGTYSDVSAQKKAALALQEATEAAKAASLSKSQFLANMSHEIRTPMNAILGMLTLLQQTELTPRQADYAAKSNGAARALLSLINEILDFSKIEAGKMTLDPHPFAMSQLLRDLSVILSSSVGTRPVDLVYDIDPTIPPFLLGDAMRIQQVLLNLGSNAIKFTSQGRVTLSIQVMQRSQDAVSLQFSMRDTGIGIAPENQARIFSGFTQAESSTTRRFGGTGLGVAISQRFVSMMGGELELQSALGVGSRFYFTITLPLAAKPEQDGASTDALSDADAGKQRLAKMHLLVVEDNFVNQQVAKELLQSEGAVVQLANHGQEGIEAVTSAKVPFDVVLMDLQMPVMDGFAATRHIRTVLGLVDLPIVAMTANAMASDREACLAAGMNDHVGKPFNLDNLVRVLRKQAGWNSGAGSSAMQQEAMPMRLQSGMDAAARAEVDLTSALQRLGGNPEFYLRLLVTFVHDMGAMPEQLQGYGVNGQTSEAVRLLHTLKGLAATLGATALSSQVAQFEKQLTTDPSPEALAQATEQACKVIERARVGLQALVSSLESVRQ